MGFGSKLLHKFKKNKRGENSAELETDLLDPSNMLNDIVKTEDKPKKGGIFGRVKKTIRIRIKRKEKNADDDPDAGDGDSGKGEKKKKTKPKKEKKKKEKKAKKAKPAKSSKKNDDGDGSGKKKKLLILIIAIAGGVAVGAAVFLITHFVTGGQSIEQMLTEARLLITEQKYDDAIKAYDKIIKKDETVVQAYIGKADALVANENTDEAIQVLTEALIPTSDDPAIQAKLQALSGEEIPDGEAASPGTTVGTGGTTVPDVPVSSFKDAAFEKMLRMAMDKSDSDTIMESELAEITSLKILGGTHASANGDLNSYNWSKGYEIDGVLYTDRGAITSLEDLKYFKSLKKLTVAYNSVTDLSGISELSSLDTLGLYCNDLVDISAVSGLKEIKSLYLYNNSISDLSPLAALSAIEVLWLDNNTITDMSSLSGLSGLRELTIRHNGLTDISAVAKMSKLKFLRIDDNNVSDISVLKDLTALTDVSFTENPINDTSPVSHVRNVNN